MVLCDDKALMWILVQLKCLCCGSEIRPGSRIKRKSLLTVFGWKILGFLVNLLKYFSVPVKSLHNMQFCEIYGYIKTQDN